MTNSLKLLLSAREAAKSLSISEKTLWNYTQPRGPIPSVKIGSRTLYSVTRLQALINDEKNEGEGCLYENAN